jgi:hypothetical protein
MDAFATGSSPAIHTWRSDSVLQPSLALATEYEEDPDVSSQRRFRIFRIWISEHSSFDRAPFRVTRISRNPRHIS